MRDASILGLYEVPPIFVGCSEVGGYCHDSGVCMRLGVWMYVTHPGVLDTWFYTRCCRCQRHQRQDLHQSSFVANMALKKPACNHPTPKPFRIALSPKQGSPLIQQCRGYTAVNVILASRCQSVMSYCFKT